MKPVVNIHEAEAMDFAGGDGEKFAARIAPIGEVIGSTGLGAMYVTVEPGKRAFPFHNHLGNDELFVILEGTGTYRFGEQEHPVKPGDVCAAPRGGPDKAHQLINTGDVALRYLGIGTMGDPDIVEYPDSGKYSAMAIAPGKDWWNAHLKVIGKRETQVDYWEGEL
ncbi:cupin domain-containing protein [Mameliella sediminis]|uniref:cupin domain-containing protein n=1 Tax=Mameliella sediminis TaxID=2836866 RepID=UPI001C4626F0|nr:cupin domain-containing protein [Mameliella sediminis]MBV7393659.1 cupin domain-containing protein [Mameliella sediminis]MBY6160941.1 cupin domain-containing protein [Mameliella alba]MBY6169411.1 cupin domain-containing protein [Mameliella alba]MBY6174430.1 cupin domain-containing protein [Mameliella alba]